MNQANEYRHHGYIAGHGSVGLGAVAELVRGAVCLKLEM